MPKGLRKIVCALLVAGVAGGVILAGNRPLAVPVAGVQTPSAPGAPAQDPESNKVVDFVADRGYPIPYGDTTATVLVGHFAAQHNGAVHYLRQRDPLQRQAHRVLRQRTDQ